MQQPDWLAWAWRELGVHEVAGSGDNPRIAEMFKTVGHDAIRDDEVAWCAAFLGACLERSGRSSTRSLMARSYLEWGNAINEARFGAIAVLSRGTDPALGHAGFIVGETEQQVFLLGGNQGNAVSVAPFAKERVLAYRWPQETAIDNDAVPERTAAKPIVAAIFDQALNHVLEMEGGFTDDPYDPGGPTNKGITLGVFARWVGETVTPDNRSRLVAKLKRIPDAMVREIYQTRYWIPAGCHRMSPALAVMQFDAAVNHGVATAIKCLQQSVGANVDGEIGPQTQARMESKPPLETLTSYAEIRRERYRALQHFWRFGRGWLRRVDVTLARAGALIDTARDSPLQDPDRGDGTNQPATEKGRTEMSGESNEAAPQAKWWGESLTIWGVIVSAASTVLPVIGPLLGLDITGEMVRQIGEQLTQVVQALGGVIGTILAIYGRVRASQPITRLPISLRL